MEEQYIIKLLHSSTHFGLYAERWQAEEARQRIHTRGSSLDIKYPLKDLEIRKGRLVKREGTRYLMWVDKNGKEIG